MPDHDPPFPPVVDQHTIEARALVGQALSLFQKRFWDGRPFNVPTGMLHSIWDVFAARMRSADFGVTQNVQDQGRYVVLDCWLEPAAREGVRAYADAISDWNPQLAAYLCAKMDELDHHGIPKTGATH